MSRLDRLSPEAALLLCCARTQPGAGMAERIRRLVHGEPNWPHLLALAEAHKVMPLLYHQLSAAAPDAVPPDVQRRLRSHFHANVRNSLFLAHQLLHLLDLFDAHGIAVLPFKGPVAGAMAYGNLHLRTFSDLDVLVRKEDVHRARALLLAQHFEERYPVPTCLDAPTSWLRTLTNRARKEAEYVRDDGQPGRTPVELHWALTPPFFAYPLDLKALWEGRQPVSLMGRTVPTFAPEDTLAYFCLHGTRHRWSYLRLVCDVAEMIRSHPELAWGAVCRRAEAAYSERILLLGLYLACELLEAPLPEHLQRRVYAGGAVVSIGEQVCKHLFRKKRGKPELGAPYLFDLRVRDRMRDGVGTFLNHLHRSLASVSRHALHDSVRVLKSLAGFSASSVDR